MHLPDADHLHIVSATGDKGWMPPMKPSNRIAILGIVIELCLAALWAWLLLQLKTGRMTAATTTADAVATISSTLGMVMGGLGGLLIVLFFVLRKREQ